MKLVVAIIVAASVSYGTYLGLAKNAPIQYALGGLIASPLWVGLLYVLLWLARQFRTKAPRVARWTGLSVFWLGAVIGVWILLGAAYAIYQGASFDLIAKLGEIAAVYFVVALAAKFGLVRAN